MMIALILSTRALFLLAFLLIPEPIIVFPASRDVNLSSIRSSFIAGNVLENHEIKGSIYFSASETC